MLRDYPLNPTLATADVKRARAWYAEKLGWEPAFEMEGFAMYRVGPGTITIYETQFAGTAQNTVAILNVRDLDATMARLRSRGVVFEDYDFGDFKTENGVLRSPDDGLANSWFKDADGNVISVLSDPTDDSPESVSAMLAASDLDRARDWYRDRLGFEGETFDGEVILYKSGDGRFSVYRTQYAGTAKNTVGGWNVPDLRAEMADLRSRGVRFEEYDFGEMKTVDGVMSYGDGDDNLNAWFTDSEGNILALTQYDQAG
jgi:catechol 2,3-dioxygenase-like lactoylglutathione lyase family enzyme